MKKYDYRKAMTNDIKDWILMNGILTQAKKEEWTYDELYDWLYDELWAHDCITGNGHTGYASEEKCQEYIASNLTTYFEAANEFCDFPNNGTPWIYKEPARHMDATIRCYLFGECIDTALKELKFDN